MGDRALVSLMGLVLVVGLVAGPEGVSAQQGVRLDSYAEWKRDGDLVVDGQRVRASAQDEVEGQVRERRRGPTRRRGSRAGHASGGRRGAGV